MNAQPILFATSNRHKVAQIETMLARRIEQVQVELPEIQAVAVREVLAAKAEAAYHQLGRAVLVEDTGLYLHAWKGLPGALVHWFEERVDNAGICRMLAAFEDRRATAETCVGYFDGVQCLVFCGQTEGVITQQPRGEGGFGWDPIFQPDGADKTFAELSAAEMESVSMRRKAVLHLRDHLATPAGSRLTIAS